MTVRYIDLSQHRVRDRVQNTNIRQLQRRAHSGKITFTESRAIRFWLERGQRKAVGR